MAASLDGKLVLAISSRALFDFEEENDLFETGDISGYRSLQLDRLDTAAKPGAAYPLIEKLLSFNTPSNRHVEVVILSRNDPISGMRVYRTAELNGLLLDRGVFTQGRPPFRYLNALKANLFLSANADDVREALATGYPAARVYPQSITAAKAHPDEIRIAFDGDAVLFSDEAERVYKTTGLESFVEHEKSKSKTPLTPGPFKPFLEALHRLQMASADNGFMRIRTALVTARSAPAHERAIRTLIDWEIEVDEAMFLGGLPKGPFLKEFEPDFFFDDQVGHCESAAMYGPTGHVISGVANQ